jgi:glycosyltransferase involved in cell wall biosynthesis
MILISVIMLVKNEAVNVLHSLPPLIQNFDDVHVLDSHSTDGTDKIARDLGATLHQFSWNGQYPKKKQWALENIPTRHDYVLMVDADEIVTDDFLCELQSLSLDADGYFISSRIVWKGKVLKYGQRNHKLCLFKKSAFEYSAIDDLDIDGGWEVEGHYQPAPNTQNATIKTIKSPIIHHDRKGNWHDRHDNYIAWEVEVTRRNAWPKDPVFWREILKRILRRSHLRPIVIFIYGFIFKSGFLDGRAGFDYAFHRAQYAWRIVRNIRSNQ